MSDYQMVNLYRLILQSLPDSTCRMIEVISAQPGEGVSTIVHFLAEAAASVANARVLICDATARPDNFRYLAAPSTSACCLREITSEKPDLSKAVQRVPSSGFSLTHVAKQGTEGEAAMNIDRLDSALMLLRQKFDLILIDAGATSQGPLGLAMAKKADRVLLVIEADRTRTPVAAAALRAIEVSGGHLLGAVLNKRRFRIPRLIYRWL